MPIEEMSYGKYEMVVTVKSVSSGIEHSIILSVYVTAVPEGKQYAASIVLGADVPLKVDPREPLKVAILLENRMPVAYSGLKIQISDALGLIQKEESVDLGILEKLPYEILIELNSQEKPVEDSLTINLLTESGKLIKSIESKKFEIIPYSSMKESEKVQNLFLGKKTTITVSNEGNSKGTYLAKKHVGFFRNLFLRTNPRAKWIRIDEVKYLGWSIDIEPQAKATIVIVESYLGLFILLVLIGSSVFVYYNIRSPLIIIKKASITRQKDGGIYGLKVQLLIKNRTGKSVMDVKVAETIPDIADVDKNLEAGTLKPDSITKHDFRGTIVKWNIGPLDRYEERLISYKIGSKLTIIGYFTLPPAVVRYVFKKKEAIVRSNRITLETGEKIEE
ncbi:MAG: hypothetical protein NTV63_03800 [Candidatus Woesearchaeota archaeon]|nr:hypothetical protein [Candidatus Woesearchaeota archaeon]